MLVMSHVTHSPSWRSLAPAAGGMKCLVEHIRLLRQRGHFAIAVHRSDVATRAMPPWTQEEADADVVCTLNQRLSDVYPVEDIDVVVVGIFHQVGWDSCLCQGLTAGGGGCGSNRRGWLGRQRWRSVPELNSLLATALHGGKAPGPAW